eukprot:4562433-Pleurochrysis_carterae.AAC.2
MNVLASWRRVGSAASGRVTFVEWVGDRPPAKVLAASLRQACDVYVNSVCQSVLIGSVYGWVGVTKLYCFVSSVSELEE